MLFARLSDVALSVVCWCQVALRFVKVATTVHRQRLEFWPCDHRRIGIIQDACRTPADQGDEALKSLSPDELERCVDAKWRVEHTSGLSVVRNLRVGSLHTEHRRVFF